VTILRHETLTIDRLLHENRLASLDLRLVAGKAGLGRTVTNPRLQKPGLALAGFLEYVKPGRVQVIGSSEAQYLATLGAATANERVTALVEQEPPLVVVCKAMEQTASLFGPACDRLAVPLAVTAITTSAVIERLGATLEFLLAPREVMHGDLLDIFAIGVLILGESGSGKSEGALELVHRGHRLVADDVVEIYKVRNEELVGQAPEEVRGLMEVRGLGLISIEQLFGVVAVRDSKPIDMVVNLVAENSEPVDRLGLSETSIEILGIRRPLLTVPVAPGKNLALLIEAAARKYLLSQRGVTDAATDYLTRHDQKLRGR
jgi:HPr kinase/phosphorylase